jgi:hypothetical protein
MELKAYYCIAKQETYEVSVCREVAKLLFMRCIGS